MLTSNILERYQLYDNYNDKNVLATITNALEISTRTTIYDHKNCVRRWHQKRNMNNIDKYTATSYNYNNENDVGQPKKDKLQQTLKKLKKKNRENRKWIYMKDEGKKTGGNPISFQELYAWYYII